ncbi:GNAT family N-acetyltransferase [Bacillus toyonensis]|uniref:GNAT family N-acetyltransferase n=1 Tax=Bacillus toyonensis TaxID=155322 RepID=UPI000BF1DAA5|nr:GNAT family N-acetyltransferase [Bacillus toyonensis]MDF9450745.1 GNAT family N-acetyltransferase [Bacillus toyonensis]MDG1564931.1 GNAT family N-acetyltransferase [Bacillus toyonensis]PEO66372.1 GNAT family N-acetyltransferase [Bacillus toyonensis]PFX70013.1 GNAT family N-acetyltransferase [Bacillus toyonensis]PFX82993.1 GNAT family N-acetyltransferase [Bacillus toyonensis]
MSIQLATYNDLEWINNQYESIGFVRSDLKRDKVAIITYNNEYAGVGRLVKIDDNTIEMGGIFILPKFRGQQLAGELVSFLVETAKKLQVKNVYCLPFEELENFYKKYGYTEVDTTKEVVHPIILKKYNWCLEHYDKHVLLFKL